MRQSTTASLIDPMQEVLEWIHEELWQATNKVCDWVSAKALTYPDSWIELGTPVSQTMFALVLAAYTALVVVGGITVMTHETLQTRYTLREIAPRLAMGLVAAWAAPIIIPKAVDISNAVVDALVSFDRTLTDHGNDVAEFRANVFEVAVNAATTFSSNPNIADVLLGVVQLVIVAVVFASSIIRKIVMVVCVMFAPAALACHALPFTESIARMWWRVFGACLGAAIGQAALVRVWSYIAFDADGAYITYGKNGLPIRVIIVVVLLWAMWKLQSRLFTAALGHPLRIPGSRLVKGLAMGAAVGAGHRLVRRWLPGNRTKLRDKPGSDTTADASQPSFRWSTNWNRPDGSQRAIRVRRPKVNKDAWSKATAKPNVLQPKARVAIGPLSDRGRRRMHVPIVPKRRVTPAATTPTPQHGANLPPTPTETTGAGPGTPPPRRIIGPVPAPDPKKFTQARRRIYPVPRRQRRRWNGDEQS